MTTDKHVRRMIFEEGADGATGDEPPWLPEERQAVLAVGEMIREGPGPPVELDQGLVGGAQFTERPREVFRGHVHQLGVHATAVEIVECFCYGASGAAMPPPGVEVCEEYAAWTSIHPLSKQTWPVFRTWAAEA